MKNIDRIGGLTSKGKKKNETDLCVFSLELRAPIYVPRDPSTKSSDVRATGRWEWDDVQATRCSYC